jgi:peptidoglycan L-alanyl-D-glutamate endopeptidase CwlK
MYKFGNKSQNQLATVEEPLQKVLRLGLQMSIVDFACVEGRRSTERQQQLYAEGKSTLDGINKRSKHQVDNPTDKARAMDICAYVNGQASWEPNHLCVIAGSIWAASKNLGIPIRWGGNWDSDGEIISDQNFVDLPHFELV